MNLRLSHFLYAPALIAICVNAAIAQHTDIEIEVENGRLVTDPRIGEGEFGEAPNPANVADEPGFEVEDGVFQPNDTLGFEFVDLLGKNLWYWDGSDLNNVNFGDSPHSLSIEHPLTNATATVNSSAGGGVPGFLIGVADAEGGVHQDLEMVLDTNPPANGIYLFGIEMTSDQYASSEPVYMVMASGADEFVHEAAIDWVADTFGVPEPSSITLLSMFGLLFAALRRRSS